MCGSASIRRGQCPAGTLASALLPIIADTLAPRKPSRQRARPKLGKELLAFYAVTVGLGCSAQINCAIRLRIRRPERDLHRCIVDKMRQAIDGVPDKAELVA